MIEELNRLVGIDERIKVELIQPLIDQSHLDAIWYESGREVAKLTFKDRQVIIIASGEVRFNYKTGEVKDGKVITFQNKMNNGNMADLGKYLQSDLHIDQLVTNGLAWFQNNNWFSYRYKNMDETDWLEDEGDVAFSYLEAFETATAMVLEDDCWDGSYECDKCSFLVGTGDFFVDIDLHEVPLKCPCIEPEQCGGTLKFLRTKG